MIISGLCLAHFDASAGALSSFPENPSELSELFGRERIAPPRGRSVLSNLTAQDDSSQSAASAFFARTDAQSRGNGDAIRTKRPLFQHFCY